MNYRLRDGLTRAGTDNNGSYVSNNATLQQKVASGAYPDVYIANWRDYTAPVRSWFVSDGIHYQPTGALGAADYISRWITLPVLRAVPEADGRRWTHRQSLHSPRRQPTRPTSAPSTPNRVFPTRDP